MEGNYSDYLEEIKKSISRTEPSFFLRHSLPRSLQAGCQVTEGGVCLGPGSPRARTWPLFLWGLHETILKKKKKMPC